MNGWFPVYSVCTLMRLGYNTNGFAHHRLADALLILSRLGYQSVAITIDHDALDPFQVDLARRVAGIRMVLQRLGLSSVVETGGRFLLDPWHKHQPTLISPAPAQRQQRLDFLGNALSIARELGADAVSFWSGTPVDDAPPAELMDRLAEGCQTLCRLAESSQLRLAFEPEPGMFIDTMARYEELRQRVDHPLFGLTIDVGHLFCLGEPIAPTLRKWRDLLFNVHIEDMRRGVHEHLMFGEGELPVAEVLAVLEEIGYEGGVHVELSRHSHMAVEIARRALEFLKLARAD